MAVFSPTNAKVHFKAYDGSFTDSLGNTSILQRHDVAMSSAQKLFGQKSMYMADFVDNIQFTTPSVFDVGTGDYTVGFWFHPVQFTTYDRLFITNAYNNGHNPLRIYCHNGTIQVYVDDSDDEDLLATDSIANYYLGADAEDQWWHIMVRRDSGTTKTYINGIERGSSTMSYTINGSASVTLGADQTGVSGTKGYIQDFFWTEEAVSFTQADFTPATAEPITFHSGNPSISSFSTSATSADDGDSVTLSWSVSGETKLELLKYVGGILSTTEDVLGLSSKLVTITETVSYKIRATNDNSAVDSNSVQITLNGGQIMAKVDGTSNAGLVLQKDMLDASSDMAAVLKVNYDGVDKALNASVSDLIAADVTLQSNIDSEEAARIAGDSTEKARAESVEAVLVAADASEAAARAAADSTELARAESVEAILVAADASEAAARAAADSTELARAESVETILFAADSTELARAESAELVLTNNLNSEIAARGAADSTELARAESVEAILVAADASEAAARAAADSTELARAESVEAILVAADASEAAARAAADSTELARAESVEAILAAADSTELARAESAELVLTNNLNSEIAARGAADSTELARAESVEAILVAADASEAAARAAADSTELARAESVETILFAADSTELARAESAELVLTNNLNSEIAARAAADSTELARAESVEAISSCC